MIGSNPMPSTITQAIAAPRTERACAADRRTSHRRSDHRREASQRRESAVARYDSSTISYRCVAARHLTAMPTDFQASSLGPCWQRGPCVNDAHDPHTEFRAGLLRFVSEARTRTPVEAVSAAFQEGLSRHQVLRTDPKGAI
jgi:hypothetical protein